MSLINRADSKRQKKRIGSYKLSRELGHGSYCQVFEAFHVLTGERVAIKLASVADSRAEPPARTFSAMYAASTARRDGSVDSIVRAAKSRSPPPSPLLLDTDAASSSSPRSLLRRKAVDEHGDDEQSSDQTDTDLSSSAELATTKKRKKKKKKKKKRKRRKKRQESSSGECELDCEPDSAQQLMRARRLQRSMSHDSSGETVVAMSRRGQSHLQQLQTEGLFLMLVDHPNIVFLKDLVYESGRIALVEELIEGSTLHAWLLSSSSSSSSSAFGRVLPSPRCSRADVCDVFRQMATAVCYVHELGLCHRDIKLENFLVASRGHALHVKLADFGFACLSPCWRSSDDHEVFVDSLLHTFVGSLHYVAPEVARKTPYHGAAADIWSLGVCLFALLHRRLPYSHAVGDDKLLAAVQSGRAADYIDPDLDPLARSLLDQLLQPSPALRIKAPQAVSSSQVRPLPSILSSGRSLSFSNSAPSMLNSAPLACDAQQPRGALTHAGSLHSIFDLQLSRLHGPAFLPGWCFDDDPVAPVDSDLVRYLTELGFSQQWIVGELASSRDNATKTYYRVLLARLQERTGYRSTNRSSPRHLLLSREKDPSRRIADSPRFAALLTERLLPILPIISRRLGPKAVLSPSVSQDQLGDPPSSLLLPHHRRTIEHQS